MARVGFALLAAVVLGVTVTGTAAASTPPVPVAGPGSSVSAPHATQLSVVPSRTVGTDAAQAAIPFAGCYGKTDNVHNSANFISVHARTVCSGASKLTSTNLQRDRWYGWEQLANGSSTGTKDAVTKWYCAGAGWYTYAASTYHRATIGSSNAIGYTGTSARLFC